MRTLVARALGLLLLAAPAAAAESPLPHQMTEGIVGYQSCAQNKQCHNETRAATNVDILQTEVPIWEGRRRGPEYPVSLHREAYANLAQPEGKRVARNLGIADPQRTEECLACHAGAGPEAFREEGVSCEDCHGPGKKWIGTHTDHANAAGKDGMYATADPVARATLCVSCHVGTPERPVSHRLLAAGHPSLTFELFAYTNTIPVHWKLGPEWAKRTKQPPDTHVWAIGQGIALEQYLTLLASGDMTSRRWPDLALYDCGTCHHDLGRRVAAPSRVGFGLPRLGDEPFVMFRRALERANPGEAARSAKDLGDLEQAIAHRSADLPGRAEDARTRVAQAVSAVASAQIDPASLVRDAALCTTPRTNVGQRLAEQLAYAVAAATSTMLQDPSVKPEQRQAASKQIQALVNATDKKHYDALRFRTQLAAFCAVPPAWTVAAR
jgi:hypothetical protein